MKKANLKIWTVILLVAIMVNLTACGEGSVEDPSVSRIKDSSLPSNPTAENFSQRSTSLLRVAFGNIRLLLHSINSGCRRRVCRLHSSLDKLNP